jgi:hypothetical protein
VSNPSDNLKNLFEIPVIFYAVALRALHSAVHCTINIVLLRFYLYLFSTLSVWFIAARAALHHLGT